MSMKFKNPIEVDGYVSAEYADLSTTTSHSVSVGEIAWNAADGTFDMGLIGGVTLQAGQEMHIYGKASGAISNGEAVMFAGVQGDHLLIAKADPVVIDANPEYFIGIATQDFANNQFGYVTVFGNVRMLNTSSYTLGSVLYFNSATPIAGQLTSSMPPAPHAKIIVAAVVKVSTTQGILMVRPQIMPKIEELQDVAISGVSDGDVLVWATNRWINATVESALGYVPANQNTTIDTLAPLQGGGDLSANRTLSITQAGGSQDGYLSSTDWNTFNSKANGFSLPQYDIPMVDATGSALTSSGARISSNSFDFVQSGSSLPFGASNLLARDANFIIGVYNGGSSSLVIKNWDASFGNYEAIEFASIGTAMSYTSVTNQWTIANGITYNPVMGTFNVYSFEINAISQLVTYGGRQLFQDYTNPGITGAVVPMVGTLGLVNSGLEVLSLGSLYLSFYSGAGNLPTAVGELQVSNSITRINIFDASGNVLDLRNYDSSNIVNITALGSYLLAGYDPSMGAYSYAGNYISYNQAMAQFKVTYFGGDVFVADWNSQTGVLFGKQIPVLNNATYFGGDIPYVTALGELTASGLSYSSSNGGELTYYGGVGIMPSGTYTFKSTYNGFEVNNTVNGSGYQLTLNNYAYPSVGIMGAGGSMIYNDAVMGVWTLMSGGIVYYNSGPSVSMTFNAGFLSQAVLDRYSLSINTSNIWSSIGQNYISVNSSYLPDNSPIVNANGITMLGVYDSNYGQYNPSYYAQRNLNVGSYQNSVVLVLGDKNSCVDFTLKIRVTNSNKFFTINGYVSVDWANSLYTFKVTSNNTSGKDYYETNYINMDFEFSGGQFLIKLDNSSGGNDLYVNINANIS